MALVVASAMLLSLGAAGSASASVSIGSANINVVADSGTLCGSCAFSNSALPGRLVASPVNGTITSWGMQATSANTTAYLRLIRPLSGNLFLFSASESRSGLSASPHTFTTSLPIALGDRIALGHNGVGSIGSFGNVTPVAGATAQGFNSPPADGGTAMPSSQSTGIDWLLNATIEPNNDATLAKLVKNKKKGTASLTESVPNPGTLVISEGPVKPQTIQVSQPGEVTVALLPNKRAKKKLRRRGKVAGGIDLIFTPSFGSPSRDTTPLTLKLKR
jgi:hypothetical protein